MTSPTSTETLRVAMGQMLVIPGELEANLERAAAMIEQAADAGAQLVVLPECLDLGWTYPEAGALAAPIPGPVTDRLCALARRSAIVVAAGVTESAGDGLYNSAVLISAAGEILAKHRKINELSFARQTYGVGNCLAVTHTDLGWVGLDICADNSSTSLGLGMALADMGAQIIVSPSAWAVPPDFDNTQTPYGDEWRTSYRHIATHGGVPVVGVSNVGPVVGGDWDGWQCIGCSLAVDASGEVLAQSPYGNEAVHLAVVEVPLGATRQERG